MLLHKPMEEETLCVILKMLWKKKVSPKLKASVTLALKNVLYVLEVTQF
jgi:hypothetical protein